MDSLYIHIPFCQKKCFYCSFVVSIGQQQRIDDYLDCLEKEASQYSKRNIESVYIGGGTPTFMDSAQLKRLFKIVRQYFSIQAHSEVTIEANPEGIDLEKAKMLFDLGINRISLGVQSLNDKYLQFLGRCHDKAKALTTYQSFRKVGFSNINLDLMYGFPDQSQKELIGDVQAICDLESEHLSLYTLTIEENSKFYVQKLKTQDDDAQADFYSFVADTLEQKGFYQYEISNFAKAQRESHHNINYWRGGNYIGLGVGAHSHKNGLRSWNVSNLFDYIRLLNNDQSPQDGSQQLTGDQRLTENILLGLRMNRGVKIQDVESSLGCVFENDKRQKIYEFIKSGWLKEENDHIKATAQGRVVLDELCAQLF